MRFLITQGFGPQAGAAVQHERLLPDFATLHQGYGSTVTPHARAA
jgi:hypothetical protein